MRLFRRLSLLAPLALGAGLALPAQAEVREPRLPVWSGEQLTRTCTRTLTRLERKVARLAASGDSRNFLRDWNLLQIEQEDLEGPVYLLNNVSPEEKVRAAADACLLRINGFSTRLFQNPALYRKARAVKAANPVDMKMRRDLLDAFEDVGVALPARKRARVKAILTRLEVIRQDFERNVRDNKTRLTFTPAEAKGLPANYLERAKKDAQGNYLLGFEYPEYMPFMDNAESEAARRRYQFAFVNRGGPRNIELLSEVAQLRREMAKLLGFPSYSHFITRRRMVEKPEVVLGFLDEVKAAVREQEQREIDELRQAKARHLALPLEQVKLNRWDQSFYQERLRRERYRIDQEALRQHFPTDAAVDWVLHVSSELFGIRFRRGEAPIWHPEVRYYDVTDARTSERLGGFYLDLFPREGKFGHAAAFGVRGASHLANRTPISVLVTNFNRKGLDYNELETLTHEFGHLLHGVLSRTRYVGHAGTNVETDFVEAPSQMYEEWARKPESLKLMKKFCQDCPEITDELLARLKAAHNFGRGIRYGRQLLYAGFDMAIYGPKPGAPLAVWQAMESDTPLGHVADTQFPGQFDHIIRNYGAGYYGYMWSEVVALDMLSKFGDNIMNAEVGRRFRREILERGGERRGSQLARTFLGRDPSPQAFFAEIRGQRLK